jgi:hypothetical protein
MNLSAEAVARLERICAALGAADATWLRERLEPRWRRRERKLSQRDELIREIATRFYALTSGREIARSLRADLLRMASLRRSAPGQPDARYEALRRLQRLSGDRVLSISTLRNALAGLSLRRGQNSLADLGHAICDNSTVESHVTDTANRSSQLREKE